jgi:hypothetical protein
MNAPASLLRGACSCGTCSFEVKGRPLGRVFCHCTICQAFNRQPFADVTFFRTRDVAVSNADQIAFKTWRPPPNAGRGRCMRCEKPVLEHFGFWPLALTFIPSANFEPGTPLPPPQLHLFYERRVADVTDALPRYDGYVRSQLAVSRMLLHSLTR